MVNLEEAIDDFATESPELVPAHPLDVEDAAILWAMMLFGFVFTITGVDTP